MNLDIFKVSNKEENEPLKLVARLRTETYFSNESVIFKKVLRVLKRKCKLSLRDVFPEDSETFDYSRIVNLHNVEDGIYEIKTINIRGDIVGFPEEWDYKLIPYKE